VGSLLRSSGLKSEDERRDFARRELGFEYAGEFPWDSMGRWVYDNSYFAELETFSPSEENLNEQVCYFFDSLSDILWKVNMELDQLSMDVLADILIEATSPPTLI
jgi:hypothetical protein